jgi:2-iminobutanoate/2-iminopropanoate deaminase
MIKKLFLICVLIGALAFAGDDEGRKVILSQAAPAPIGPYSQAILNGKQLFVSGQIGLKKDGTLDTSSVENECRQVMTNLRAIVEEAGMKMSDIHKTTIYTTDIRMFARINAIYGSYFTSDPPARETIGVSALPKGARIEISAIAGR